MICTCQDWVENIDKANAGFVISAVHGMGGYGEKQWAYCPWCGASLSDELPISP